MESIDTAGMDSRNPAYMMAAQYNQQLRYTQEWQAKVQQAIYERDEHSKKLAMFYAAYERVKDLK